MDDFLEQPNAVPATNGFADKSEVGDLSSGDEDEGLDWTKLPSSSSRPVIPKRGDKDFEPSIQGGSELQRHVLDRARNAMFDALRAERNTSSKSISHGVWYPALARTHVTTVRGIHFTSMGHSVARPIPTSSAPSSSSIQSRQKAAKRLELLPEEAIYLVERGSMFCWKAIDGETRAVDSISGSKGKETGKEEEMGLGLEGAPMSVQQVFAEMVGTEGLSLEKYQVFAYLKRLGYVVMRTKAPSPAYLTAAPYSPPVVPSTSVLARIFRSFTTLVRSFMHIFTRTSSWGRPSLFHHGFSYPGIFESLRFLPSGHAAPLNIVQPNNEEPSPYEVFFNVYKPATAFKKTAPPEPDFQVVVVNARTTPVPTLSELTDLFDILPELPPPIPRKRLSYTDQKKQVQPSSPFAAPSSSRPSQHTNEPVSQPSQPPSPFLLRLFSWIFPTRSPAATTPERKPNPFAVLKQGKKMVVVAAVDAGMISFFSFRQGGFEEFPMVGS